MAVAVIQTSAAVIPQSVAVIPDSAAVMPDPAAVIPQSVAVIPDLIRDPVLASTGLRVEPAMTAKGGNDSQGWQ
jgi:hypothetical protein